MTPHTLIKDGQEIVPKLSFDSIDQALTTWSATHQTKPAIIFDDFVHDTTITLTYQDIDDYTKALAFTFADKFQLSQKDHISFAFSNTPEILLLNYAAWRSGLVTVPLDTTRDTVDRKVFKLKLTNTKVLFTRDSPEVIKENKSIQKHLPDLTIVTTKNYESFIQTYCTKSGDPALEPGLEKDCLILFTSGTTADPKGVRLTPLSLFANAVSIQDWLQITDQDRFHILLPLHHINSTTFANTTLLAGGTIILSPRYSKSQFWKTMATCQATASSIVPTIAYDLLSESRRYAKYQVDLNQVSRIQLGSAPVQPKVVNQFYHQYGIRLVQGYGQTETSLRSTGVPLSLSESEYLDMVKSNSIGTELALSNVTVLKKDGHEASEGDEGDICVRGPLIMKGYLNNEKATTKAFKYQWFHSGDTGYWKQENGRKYYYLIGRTKEIIKKGGVLVSPLSIENTLLESFPDIDQVFVVGFSHPRYGQDVGAIVVSDSHPDSQHWQEKFSSSVFTKLATFEKPQSVIVVKPSDLPKTSTGKVQRTKMSEIFGQELRLQSLAVTSTKTHTFRLLEPDEETLLKQASVVSQDAWGSKALGASYSELQKRTQNGIVIGALNTKGRLEGLISALRIKSSELDQAGESGHWTSTWDGITDKGILESYDQKGDTMVCVAISVSNSTAKKSPPLSKGELEGVVASKNKQPLTKESLLEHLNQGKDYVIRFHQKPKGGFDGATITQIIMDGRPADQDALGINVILHYPQLDQEPKLTKDASLGQQLIESAMIWAHKQGIMTIAVYSRPAQASEHFTK